MEYSHHYSSDAPPFANHSSWSRPMPSPVPPPAPAALPQTAGQKRPYATMSPPSRTFPAPIYSPRHHCYPSFPNSPQGYF
ncbi:unnamed protein product [Protopolystoma xenopodis]|uniref:Uncharacterized protein n=1 Tax=Protopolystoma xenopodis TaxID=117903 RepID=A0A3S5B6H3_9PLAT|nr:unnamed protein product [Protopolystoma xenopodis]